MFFYFILLNLIIFSSQQTCKKYKCGELPQNFCLQEKNSTIDNTVEIIGKNCDGNKICPLLDFYNNGNSTCIGKANDIFKQFPGGSCKNPDECFSKNCTKSICVGIDDGNICGSNDECYFNRACYLIDGKTSKTCNKLKENNSKCENDYECQMNSGCFNGFCTPYFSLPNEADVTSANFKNFFSFCKSGYSYKGYCQTLINLDDNMNVSDELVPCNKDKKCFYKISNSSNPLELSDVCDTCGKSKDGKIYCPIYGGHKLYSRYVDYIKKTLNDTEIIKNCNTNERKGICNYHKQKSETYKELIQTINTYQMRQRDFQTYANSDDCILQIFNNQYNKDIDNPVDPEPTDEKKCPIFKCNFTDNTQADEKVCARNIFNKTSKILEVSLFERSCNWNSQKCVFNNNFNTTNDSNSLCKDIENLFTKFPGEKCDVDDDCFAEKKTDIYGICANKTKVCLGSGIGESCAYTSQCNKGLYCKKSELKSECQEQLDLDKICESSFDCKNNLACFNKTCQDVFYSKSIGDEIDENFDTENFSPEIYCESRLVTRTNDSTGKLIIKCANKFSADEKNSSISNLVKCEFNDKCNYVISDNSTEIKIQENCGCGYNKDGIGYCPRGHDTGKLNKIFKLLVKDKWTDLKNEFKNTLNNRCHSLSRFTCDESLLSTKLHNIKKETELSHLFYEAVPCAEIVLSSIYLKNSIAFLFTILILSLF
jgi:hypothetical protein